MYQIDMLKLFIYAMKTSKNREITMILISAVFCFFSPLVLKSINMLCVSWNAASVVELLKEISHRQYSVPIKEMCGAPVMMSILSVFILLNIVPSSESFFF
jgi:hypothetical protein